MKKQVIIFYVFLTKIVFCSASQNVLDESLQILLEEFPEQVLLELPGTQVEQVLLNLEQPVIVTQTAIQKSEQPEQSVTNKYTCTDYPPCTKSFKLKPDLTRHILTHTGERPFTCETCGNRFNQMSILKTHQRKVHSKKTDFKCTEGCPETFFGNQAKLTQHLKEKHGIVVRNYVCKINNCGKTYSQKSHLDEHIEATHNPITFTCSFEGCNAVSKSEKQLAQHQKNHSQKNKAKTEMDSNDEAGPADEKATFKCLICEKVFDKKFNLTRHMKNVHKK